MSTLVVKGNWKIAKGRLRQKFAHLVNEDWEFIEEHEDELIGRMQQRMAPAKTEIRPITDARSIWRLANNSVGKR